MIVVLLQLELTFRKIEVLLEFGLILFDLDLNSNEKLRI